MDVEWLARVLGMVEGEYSIIDKSEMVKICPCLGRRNQMHCILCGDLYHWYDCRERVLGGHYNLEDRDKGHEILYMHKRCPVSQRKRSRKRTKSAAA